MTHRLTKAQLRDALGVDTDAAVADFFEISRSAVAQWGDGDPIPELRQLQAERKRPDLFPQVDTDIEHATGQGGDTPGPQRPTAALETAVKASAAVEVPEVMARVA